ncbi:MAG: hydrogenase 3 maturation endopeptidase HyCI [Anaerolineae bacterium]|nr:hydrogenase 3 maturation endopeptidase HyCI [Anaerolineae bacterium]
MRIALLGVGNAQNGDDAAGVYTARLLINRLRRNAGEKGRGNRPSFFLHPRLAVYDAGLAPENFTGPLRRFSPEVVVLVDAASFGGKPGEIVLTEAENAGGFGASTHLQPLSTLARFLTLEMGVAVWLLGVQPATNDLGAPISPLVRRACQKIAREVFLTTQRD